MYCFPGGECFLSLRSCFFFCVFLCRNVLVTRSFKLKCLLLFVRSGCQQRKLFFLLLPEFHLWLKEIPLAKLQQKKKFIFRSIDRSSSSALTNLQLNQSLYSVAFTTSAQTSMNSLFVFLSALLSSKNLLKWIQFSDSV